MFIVNGYWCFYTPEIVFPLAESCRLGEAHLCYTEDLMCKVYVYTVSITDLRQYTVLVTNLNLTFMSFPLSGSIYRGIGVGTSKEGAGEGRVCLRPGH